MMEVDDKMMVKSLLLKKHLDTSVARSAILCHFCSKEFSYHLSSSRTSKQSISNELGGRLRGYHEPPVKPYTIKGSDVNLVSLPVTRYVQLSSQMDCCNGLAGQF